MKPPESRAKLPSLPSVRAAAEPSSPFEHQAQGWTSGVRKSHLNGNLRGWHQFRKMIEAGSA